MALQTIKPGLKFPYYETNYAFDYNFRILNELEDKVTGIIEVPKSGTIDAVIFRTGTVTTAQTLRVSVETVDITTGNPTGTNYGGSSPGTQTSPVSNTQYIVSLAVGATATIGDIIAIVVQFDTVAGNLNIVSHIGSIAPAFPYGNVYDTTGAAWTKQPEIPAMTIRYSDGTYEPINTLPTSNVGYYTYNSDSSPDERTLRIYLPFPRRASGFYAVMDALANLDVILYQGITQLTSVSIDSDIRSGVGRRLYSRRFPSPQTLSANTEYYLSFKPTTTTSIQLVYFNVSVAALMNSFAGGQNIYQSTRVDGGGWTAVPLIRIYAGIIIDQLDDGADGGGGGIKVHPGMGGGMRG